MKKKRLIPRTRSVNEDAEKWILVHMAVGYVHWNILGKVSFPLYNKRHKNITPLT